MRLPRIPAAAPLWLSLALVAQVFAPVLGFELLAWDDADLLTQNALVQAQAPADLLRVFDPVPAIQGRALEYFPVRDAAYAALHLVGGLTPWPYHLLNLLLHLLNTYLVFALCRRLGLAPATGVAACLLFGLHPVHVEAVAWVSGLKEVLMTAFLLLSTLAFARHVEGQGRRYGAAALLLALLAGLSKHVGVVAWALWALYLLCRPDPAAGRRTLRQVLQAPGPWRLVLLCLGLGTLLAAFSVQVGQGNLDVRDPFSSGAGASSALAQPYVQGQNVLRLLAPVGLVPAYEPPRLARGAADPAFWGPAALWLLALGLLGLAWRRRARAALFAAGLYGVTLGPFVLFQVGRPLSADRDLYQPSVGFCILCALGLQALGRRLHPLLARGALAALCLLLLAGTARYLPHWRADEPFFRMFVARAPERENALLGMATFLVGRQRWAEALPYYRRFFARYEASPRYVANYGVCLLHAGHAAEAAALVRRHLQAAPEDAHLNNTAGYLLALGGRPDLAVAHFEAALARDPQMLDARLNLLHALADLGQLAPARLQLRRVESSLVPAHLAPRVAQARQRLRRGR